MVVIIVTMVMLIHVNYVPINVKPEVGRGPRAYVWHLITFAISTLRNWTESLVPRVGTFDFLGEEDWALIKCFSEGSHFEM